MCLKVYTASGRKSRCILRVVAILLFTGISILLFSTSCTKQIQVAAHTEFYVINVTDNDDVNTIRWHLEKALKRIERHQQIHLTIVTNFSTKEQIHSQFEWLKQSIHSHQFSGVMHQCRATQDELYPQTYYRIKFFINDGHTLSTSLRDRSVVQIIYRSSNRIVNSVNRSG